GLGMTLRIILTRLWVRLRISLILTGAPGMRLSLRLILIFGRRGAGGGPGGGGGAGGATRLSAGDQAERHRDGHRADDHAASERSGHGGGVSGRRRRRSRGRPG